MSNEIKHTELTLYQRNRLTLNGVKSVENFEPDYVSVELNDNQMTIEGEGMKIESLNQATGELTVIGQIDGVFYIKKKAKRGLLAGLLG